MVLQSPLAAEEKRGPDPSDAAADDGGGAAPRASQLLAALSPRQRAAAHLCRVGDADFYLLGYACLGAMDKDYYDPIWELALQECKVYKASDDNCDRRPVHGTLPAFMRKFVLPHPSAATLLHQFHEVYMMVLQCPLEAEPEATPTFTYWATLACTFRVMTILIRPAGGSVMSPAVWTACMCCRRYVAKGWAVPCWTA
ncbi:hypothetical protein ABPG75_008430 [Micractinium tetrahymenae]